MTTPTLAVSLALVHATLVALATLVARASIPRRFAASRATVGLVGAICVLVVTALTLLPLPGVWPNIDAPPSASQHSSPLASHPPGPESLASAADAPPSDPSGAIAAGVQLPLEWLWRLGNHLQRATVAAEASPPLWRWLVLTLLLGGSVICLLRLLIAIRSVGHLRHVSSLVTDTAIGRTIDQLKQRCGCRRRIEVRETDQLASAAACGWWRPIILFPANWSQWSAEELSAVLAHEVAHIHRADYLQRLIVLMGAAVHFYHPLVRAAARRLAIDQEFAADQLARGLGVDEKAYTRGLARLALRYDESLSDKPGWSNVSVMPRSSDFLARRLEMLRVKNHATGKRAGRLVAFGASAGLVAIALATALLRGATAADESATKDAPPVAETARRELPTVTEWMQSPRKGGPLTSAEPGDHLFDREQFDLSMIRHGEKGGFLIRVGDIFRHPQLEPWVAVLNDNLTVALCQLITMPEGLFEVCEIEWVAGSFSAWTKGPRKPGEDAQFMFASQGMVIRMNHAADWQEFVLKNVPGSSLEHYDGKSYVLLPEIAQFGSRPRLRFPNETTIVTHLSTLATQAEDEAKILQRFFDDTPKSYAWANAWQAVDGGLITCLFDNSKAGWLDLPAEKKEPVFKGAWPLLEKTKYFAAGVDWSLATGRTGLRVRSVCPDRDSVESVRLAALSLVPLWKEQAEQSQVDAAAKQRILDNLDLIQIRSRATDSDDHFVDAQADFPPDCPWAAPLFLGMQLAE